MKTFVVLIVLFNTLLIAGWDWPLVCITNTQDVAENQKEKTNTKLDDKEKEIEKEIEKYKVALKNKREMMLKLDHNITRIEHVMKENQVLRNKMLTYWKDVKKTNSRVMSF